MRFRQVGVCRFRLLAVKTFINDGKSSCVIVLIILVSVVIETFAAGTVRESPLQSPAILNLPQCHGRIGCANKISYVINFSSLSEQVTHLFRLVNRNVLFLIFLTARNGQP